MVAEHFSDGRAGIDAGLVRRLLAVQFPQWADLPIEPVKVDGWDNRTYRLGEEMTVRLPTGEGYAPAVRKEHRWLPVLAPELPVDIPTSLALGEPGAGYRFPWSVRGWIPGETATADRIDDLPSFAVAVAEFITALQRVDPRDGPRAGAHSFHRGASLTNYDRQTREALAALRGRIDTEAARRVWDAALAATWQSPPVWFHGDMAGGNLLVIGGKLSAVIDFGTCGVGDPACDLVIAWTMFAGDSRTAFRDAVAHDDAAWARARGWALWKSLILLAGADPNLDDAAKQHRILGDVIAEHDRAA